MSSKPRVFPTVLECFLWFAFALALFWTGNGAHSLWDRDEPRYSVATSVMLATGDWVVPHFNGGIRYDKPVLIYWLMAVPAQLLGVNAFSMRAAQGLAGALTVVVVLLMAARMGASVRGWRLAALCAMMFTLLTVVSKAATTDAWLTLLVTSAMAIHWEQCLRGFAWWRHGSFWAVLGLAMLLKGPVGLALVGLAILAQRVALAIGERRMPAAATLAVGAARTAVGLLIMVGLCVPWVMAVNEATDGEFLSVALGRHVVERSTRALDGHSGPFFYYLPVVILATFPFCAVMMAAFAHHWTRRRTPESTLLWCWIVPGFVMFSAVSTKLPHYMAPLLTAQALMIGLWLTALEGEPAGHPVRWRRTGAWIMGVVGVALAIGVPVAAAVVGLNQLLLPAGVAVLALGGGAVWGAVRWWHGRVGPAIAAWGACHLAGLLVAFLWVLPAMEPLRPAPVLARWLQENVPADARIGACDYREPSLVFYVGRQVEMIGRSDSETHRAVAMLTEGPPMAVVIPVSQWETWEKRLGWPVPPTIRAIPVGRFYLFTAGRWADMVVLVNWPSSM